MDKIKEQIEISKSTGVGYICKDFKESPSYKMSKDISCPYCGKYSVSSDVSLGNYETPEDIRSMMTRPTYAWHSDIRCGLCGESYTIQDGC